MTPGELSNILAVMAASGAVRVSLRDGDTSVDAEFPQPESAPAQEPASDAKTTLLKPRVAFRLGVE